MKKIIRWLIQLLLLAGMVATGYLAVREWQRNKTQYKGKFMELKNRLGRDVKIGRQRVRQETAEIIEEADIKAEMVKVSKPVQKAKAVIEKVIPGEQFPDARKIKQLSPRQNIIYAIMKSRKQVEMKDLLMRISGVTERTLRRDLLKLQALKLITKNGTTKAVTYVIK